MSENKTDKELAFLHDLYVATDWGERFAELMDEHVPLPKSGHALYVGAGTGALTILLARVLPQAKLVGVDFTPKILEDARAQAQALGVTNAEFQEGDALALPYADDSFDRLLEIGFAGSIRREWAWRRKNGESTANLAAFARFADPDR